MKLKNILTAVVVMLSVVSFTASAKPFGESEAWKEVFTEMVDTVTHKMENGKKIEYKRKVVDYRLMNHRIPREIRQEIEAYANNIHRKLVKNLIEDDMIAFAGIDKESTNVMLSDLDSAFFYLMEDYPQETSSREFFVKKYAKKMEEKILKRAESYKRLNRENPYDFDYTQAILEVYNHASLME